MLPVAPTGAFRITPVGAVPMAQHVTFDDWVTEVTQMLAVASAVPLIVGDMLLYGETRYGETYSQALGLGIDYGTAADWCWVCRAVPLALRLSLHDENPDLEFSYSMFRAVAPIRDAELQRELLLKAATDRLTVAALRDMARSARQLPPPAHYTPAPVGNQSENNTVIYTANEVGSVIAPSYEQIALKAILGVSAKETLSEAVTMVERAILGDTSGLERVRETLLALLTRL